MTSSTVSIKNVEDDVWREFKSEAAKHGMSLGDFLSELVEEHTLRESDKKWEKIFEFTGSISKSDAEDLKESAKEIRKGFEMRDHDFDS